ncbi:VOC family protein [Streptomyces sp. NPDC059070]|uniref:VOC family protein n=1 Tax=unclassified Streptomyces TaxID=2593676 RepID=UPI0034E277A3
MSAQPAKPAQKITPFLWFDDQAEEAARHYVSVFGGDARIVETTHCTESAPGRTGSVLTVVFELYGQQYTALNGGPQGWSFNESVSLAVDCDSQEEIDALWSALTADGGEPGPCGWLKDKYGLSWQIVPRELRELLTSGGPAAADRVMAALLGMKKLDVAVLRAAYDAN